MIVSYNHNVIYWKPVKVGGTSVLQVLGKHCGRRDVVCQPRGLEGHKGYGRNMRKVASNTHATPEMIIDFLKLTKRQWDAFFKFTIVRNPRDECVYRFWHRIHCGKFRVSTEDVLDMKMEQIRFHFKDYLHGVKNTNLVYYFGEDGRPLADSYMRFERLCEDYRSMCRKLMLPVEPLPRMKSGFRKIKIPYSAYYDDESIHMVRVKFAVTIDYFGYDFATEADPSRPVH